MLINTAQQYLFFISLMARGWHGPATEDPSSVVPLNGVGAAGKIIHVTRFESRKIRSWCLVDSNDHAVAANNDYMQALLRILRQMQVRHR